MSRRTRTHPVEARRRTRALQYALLSVLSAITLALVYLAMTSNG